jgi:putative transcriptional regulator
MATKTVSKKTRVAKRPARRHTVGARIIEGLEQAVAWTQGQSAGASVTVVRVPHSDVKEIRRGMGLSQSQFAAKFGFPLATLQNWEQGRARPDTPTRVLLAVIARHPEAVEDVLGTAG